MLMWTVWIWQRNIEKYDVWKYQLRKCFTYLNHQTFFWDEFWFRIVLMFVMYGLPVEMIGSSLLCQAVNNTDDIVWYHTVVIITCLPISKGDRPWLYEKNSSNNFQFVFCCTKLKGFSLFCPNIIGNFLPSSYLFFQNSFISTL